MRLIDADALRAKYQAILDRGDMFCEYDIIGMLDNAPTVDIKPFANVTFDKDELEQIVRDRVIEPIKSGELVVKDERPQGEWIKEPNSRTTDLYRCSVCKRTIMLHKGADMTKYPFCHCGAKMRVKHELNNELNELEEGENEEN